MPAAPLRRLQARLAAHLAAGLHPEDPERGDVPGWVLITIMSAGLVTVIWGVADDQLTTLLRDALDAVRAP